MQGGGGKDASFVYRENLLATALIVFLTLGGIISGASGEPLPPENAQIAPSRKTIMSSVNLVILIGNLGADPEVRSMPDGNTVCNFRMATTDTWKDKATGEKKEATEWHRVVLYRKLGEIAGRDLKKGSSVYIEGRLRTRKWQDQNGQERYSTEIEASEMKMLGSRPAGSQEDSTPKPASNPTTIAPSAYGVDDDIPF